MIRYIGPYLMPVIRLNIMSKKIAILIVAKGRSGGMERRFKRLAEEISSEAYFSSYLIAREAFLKEFDEGGGGKLALFNRRLYKLCWEIIRHLREKQITCLHIASNPSVLTFVLACLARVIGVRVSISSVDSSKSKLSDFSLLSLLSHQFTYLAVNKIDFLSSSIYSFHRRIFFIGKAKACVSPCSFLSSSFKVVAKKKKDYDLCFVSRLVPKKGVELLFKALEEIDVPLKVRICGEGELSEFVNTKISELNHHIIDVGYCPNPIEILSNSKIFLSLQASNNYPSQSLFEAIYARCAVIATDVGETRKILRPQYAKLISDYTGLVRAIEDMAFADSELCSITEMAYNEVFSVHNIDNFKRYFLKEVVEV